MNSKPATIPPEGRGDPFGLVGARLDSRYEVTGMVAQGGFGVVYRAQHRELRKPVAIKVLKTPGDLTPNQHSEFLKRFAEEARTVAQLDHPHIVRVLDFGTSIMPSGVKAPWMALEWLEGVTLEADFDGRIENGTGGRSPAESMALMYPVIEAVGIAHEEGIVHRDIKPGNLMIVKGRRGDPRLKLLDFGIAKVMAPEERRAADRAQTLTQVQAFSPDYAAPEQVSGMRTGPWTDVHALALLMSEMLTAMVPFEGNDAMEMCSNVLSPRRPTPGRRGGVDVGPWEEIFARALSLKPSDRYNNAGEFLTALMNHLPPGVDPNDAQLWISQTGNHSRPPAQGLNPRASSLPAPGPASAPSPAVRIGSLRAPSVSQQLALTDRPPVLDDVARAPTLLTHSAAPPRDPSKLAPAREVLPEIAIPEAPPEAARPLPGYATAPRVPSFDPPTFQPSAAWPSSPSPALTSAPPSFGPSAASGPNFLSPAPSSPDDELIEFELPSFAIEDPAAPPLRRSPWVAPMLVVIGLFFVGLVATAVVLVVRARAAPTPTLVARDPAIAARAPTAPGPPPPVALVDAGAVPVAVAAVDAATPVAPVVETPAEAAPPRHHGHHRAHSGTPPTLHHTHRHHRRHDAPAE
jgi:serine/threonine protein kinase